MLVSTVLLLGYQLTAPRAGLAPIRASAGRMSAAEDAAKAAWLAKQDTPAFGGAAASAAGAAVSPGPMSSAGEQAAKAAWLAKMDAPAWGTAVAAVAAASSMAAASSEDEAKRAWLAKLDAPTWGAVAAAVSEVAAGVGPAGGSDNDAAKKLWLAKLDAPTWGKAATALVDIAGSAGAVAAMEDACDQGVTEACDGLSREEEAKRAYLARLDAPTWGAVAAAVSEVAAATVQGSEDVAKAAWLAKLDAPTWGKAAKALVDIAGQAGASAAMEKACDQGVEVACDGMSREEEAKRAYLAKLDAPTWGAVTAAVASVASAVTVGGGGAVSAEDIAKQKWLAASDTLFA